MDDLPSHKWLGYFHKAKERNEEFQVEYGKVINRFTAEFIKDFCQPDGTILWSKLVEYNSGAKS